MLCDNLEGGMGWQGGGSFKREGTYIYLWLIHVDKWQKPTQHYKAVILQLKIKFLKTLKTPHFCLKEVHLLSEKGFFKQSTC